MRSDVSIMVIVGLFLTAAFSFVLFKLIDQTDSHIKKVSETRVKTSSSNLWKPVPNECDMLLKHDAETKSQDTFANYRNLEFSKQGFSYLRRMRNLRTLKIIDCTVEDKWTENLAELPLLELSLAGSEVTGSCAHELARIQSLEILDLNRSNFTDDGITPLSKLPALQLLNLNNTRVTDASADALSKLQNLRTLRVAWTHITSDSLALIAKLNKLHWLDFGNNKINSAQDLELLKTCKTLRKLNLSRCQLKNSDLVSVSRISQLDDLALDGNEISDAGIKALATLKSLKKLSILDCKVSVDGVERLKKLLPNCEISTGTGRNPYGF